VTGPLLWKFVVVRTTYQSAVLAMLGKVSVVVSVAGDSKREC
jgi:hypothetical protein